MRLSFRLIFVLGAEFLSHALAVTIMHRLGGQIRAPAKQPNPLAGCVGFECVEKYIALPDASYSWVDTGARVSGVDETSNVAWEGYVLNMTSLTWNTPAKVDNPVWWHILTVIVPANLDVPDWATLMVDFGVTKGDGTILRIDNRAVHEPVQDSIQDALGLDEYPFIDELPNITLAIREAVYHATHSRSIAASLLCLPNAQETFGDDPEHLPRAGDFLKGYSYGDFIDHPDEAERIDELPVAKAIVRALDTITAFTSTSKDFPNGPVIRFGVQGYSKLGTASFMAAAADHRIQAAAPANIYLDFMDMVSGVHIAEEVAKLLENGVPDESDDDTAMGSQYAKTAGALFANTSAAQALHSIIDPVAWSDRLVIPTLFILCTSDSFVGPAVFTQPQKLYSQFPSPKGFLMIENFEHDHGVVPSLPYSSAFFRGVALGKSVPELESSFDEATGTISAHLKPDWASEHTPMQAYPSDHTPVQVSRMCGEPGVDDWMPTPIQETVVNSGAWAATIDASSAGPRGCFILFEFAWPEPGFKFRLSTPGWVLPAQSDE